MEYKPKVDLEQEIPNNVNNVCNKFLGLRNYLEIEIRGAKI